MPHTRGLLLAALACSGSKLIISVTLIILATESAVILSQLVAIVVLGPTFQLAAAGMMVWLCWREKQRLRGAAGAFDRTTKQRKSDALKVASVVGVAEGLALATTICVRLKLDTASSPTGGRLMIISTVMMAAWIVSIFIEATWFFALLLKKQTRYSYLAAGCASQSGQLLASGHGSAEYNIDPKSSESTQCFPMDQMWKPEINSLNSLQSFSNHPRLSRIRSSASLRRYSRSSSQLRSCPATPSPRQSADSAFDAWDTSSVSREVRESLQARSGSPAPRSRLPPIPGSRSVSPARALDGPFPATLDQAVNKDAGFVSKATAVQLDTLDLLPPSPTLSHRERDTGRRKAQPEALPNLATYLDSVRRSRSPSTRSLPSEPPPSSPLTPVPRSAREGSRRPRLYQSPSFDSVRLPSRRNTPTKMGQAQQPSSPVHSLSPSSPCPAAAAAGGGTTWPFYGGDGSGGDSQIHPLFRADSPSPPPKVASPATRVSAAPAELRGEVTVRMSPHRVGEAAANAAPCSAAPNREGGGALPMSL